MKLFKLLTAFIFLGLFSSNIMAQTVHQVAEGDSTLAAAIADATDGDIIELITDGGIYTNSNKVTFDKSLVIRAHESLTTKPVVKYNGTSTSAAMFTLKGSPRVVFKDIEFDGDGITEGGAGLAKYAIIMDNDDTLGTMSLFVDNCDFHDFSDKLIKPYADCGMDSLVVTNSLIYNTDEGIFTSSGSSSDPPVILDYAEISNCTFYNLAGEAIKGDTFADIKVVVDHCTFFNIGGADKAFIYFDDALDVLVKNSIFQRNNETGNFIRLEGVGSFVNNCIVWDVNDWEIDNATVTDTLHANPLYTDAANGDFTLLPGSPALGFADDGKSLGDKRWDPLVSQPTVFKIEAGLNTISDAITTASDGDIIELVTSGGLYSYNTGSDKIIIDKSLEIRAREGLAQKPIIKNIRPSSTSVRIFEISAGGNLICRGINFDGTDDTGAPYAKNIIRNTDASTQADSFRVSYIKLYDCDLSGVRENFLKGHEFTRIDTVIVENCTFITGGREAIYFREGTDRVTDVGYIGIKNCTFSDIGREAIYHNTKNTIIRIDHCTFDNIAADIGQTDRAIYLAAVEDAQITNSIISNHTDATDVVSIYGNSEISYCDTFNVGGIIKLNDAATASNIFSDDPMYIDAPNKNYTLASSSTLRGVGSDGEALGDLRWAIDPNSNKVSIVTVGNGIVTMDPPGGNYLPGTSVTLTAIPDNGWAFESWSGISVFPPDQNPTTITVNNDIEVTALFKNLTEQVKLKIDAIGLGSVVAEPDTNVGGTYNKGDIVKLTATPSTDWVFVEWLGDIASTDNPVSFAVDSNMTVTASYKSTLTQFALNMTLVGKGAVNINPMPIIDTYDTNTVVHLTAVPALGWAFEGWTVDLVSTSLSDSVTMNSVKNVTATFVENVVPGGVLEIDSTWDFYDAVQYANNNSSVNTLLLTTAGVYTSHSSSTVTSRSPLNIIAADGLPSKPIITNSDPNGADGTIDIIRSMDDITIKGVIIDGSTSLSAGMKYGVRFSNSTAPDTVKWGSNASFKDVEFRHLYDDGKPTGDGHAFKLDINVRLGVLKFEECTFNDIGYEAIRMSDTEKWVTDRIFDSLFVRNCSFTNIDAECVRYYSDLDPATPDAPIIIENVTVDHSATSAFYLKNSGGAIVRNIIISNNRLSGHGRDNDLMNVQGNGDILSFVSNIDTFNVSSVPIATVDNEIDESTIYGINPMYEDADNMNWTLLANSHLYNLGYDGKTIGDLRWATNTPTSVALSITAENGSVLLDPLPIGKTYDPQTVVTVTAVPDSGYLFVNWTGDLTGNVNPSTITMDGSKSVTAVFDVDTDVNDLQIPKEFGLSQNYPNPFNPSTTINFALPVQSVVTLRIYDILGQVVTTLYNNKIVEAGYQSVHWNGINLASGLYIYRIDAKGSDGKEFVKSLKMMFLK